MEASQFGSIPAAVQWLPLPPRAGLPCDEMASVVVACVPAGACPCEAGRIIAEVFARLAVGGSTAATTAEGTAAGQPPVHPAQQQQQQELQWQVLLQQQELQSSWTSAGGDLLSESGALDALAGVRAVRSGLGQRAAEREEDGGVEDRHPAGKVLHTPSEPSRPFEAACGHGFEANGNSSSGGNQQAGAKPRVPVAAPCGQAGIEADSRQPFEVQQPSSSGDEQAGGEVPTEATNGTAGSEVEGSAPSTLEIPQPSQPSTALEQASASLANGQLSVSVSLLATTRDPGSQW
mmetsp:Transcript_37484/g.106318  ORF Transcript_37484/g.106318 Transcript_37484/m.106318 type:complete len:291 (-) Transcript_37484:71-943(-)